MADAHRREMLEIVTVFAAITALLMAGFYAVHWLAGEAFDTVRFSLLSAFMATLAVAVGRFANARRVREHLQIGDLERAAGHLPEALTAYRMALRADRYSGAAHCRAGIVYELQGNKTEAMAEYQRSIACDPNIGEPRYRRARLLAESIASAPSVENLRGALSNLREAIMIDDWARERATADPGFNAVHAEPEFQEIVKNPAKAAAVLANGIRQPEQ
ncbi:MAG: hypothetical protein WC712_01940 [Candidatus Brocadiia bacterium]